MRQPAAAISAIAGLLVVSAAFAQNVPPLHELTACRASGGGVVVSFEFDGSPCWTTGGAIVTEGYAPEVAQVTFPTTQTAEFCTMNIVAIGVATTLGVEPAVSFLDVAVLDPAGEPTAMGSTDVAPAGPDCVEPPAAE